MVEIAITNDKNIFRDILKKGLVEALPMGVVKAVQKRIGALPITQREKEILDSVVEGKGYILEKTLEGTVNDVVDDIFDRMDWTEK